MGMAKLGISRRDFLTRVGQAGGFGAAFSAMRAMGLLFAPEAAAEDFGCQRRRARA